MAVLSLVLCGAILCGMWGAWWDQVFFVLVYGVVIALFSRGWQRYGLLLALLVGVLVGTLKVRVFTPPPLQKGYTEMQLTITSQPFLTPDHTYFLQSENICLVSEKPFSLGDTLFVYGVIKPSNGVWFLYPKGIELIKRRFFLSWLSDLSLFWQERIERNVSSPSLRAMIFALVLGNRLYLDYGTREEFRATGLFHLLALSGLHLAFLAAFLERLLSFVFSRRIVMPIVAILLSLYTLIVGASPSLVRATLFVWGYVVLADRRETISFLHWVGLSALVFCVFLPPSWLGVGWSLSFLAVIGIVLFAPVLQLLFQHVYPLDGIVATTLSANMITFPLLAIVFGQLSVISFLANVLVLPLFPFFLGGCFFTAGVAIFGVVPQWFLLPFEWLWEVIAGIVHWLSFISPVMVSLSPRGGGWLYALMGLALLVWLLRYEVSPSLEIEGN